VDRVCAASLQHSIRYADFPLRYPGARFQLGLVGYTRFARFELTLQKQWVVDLREDGVVWHRPGFRPFLYQ
jgi:hypothetical protein